MKFYFCETCGKRITDRELEEGSARNKQLKGIFCQDCAVGVNTIEFEPIKLDPKPAPARSTPKHGLPAARSTPRSGMPDVSIARATPKSGNATAGELARLAESSSGKPVPRSIPQSQVAMLAGAALIIVAGAVALAIGLRKSPPQTATLPEPKVENVAPAIQPLRPSSAPAASQLTVPPAQPQEKAPEEKQIVTAPNSDPEAEAARVFEEVRKFNGLVADDNAGRIAAIETFLKSHGDSIVGVRARMLLEGLKKAADPSASVAPPPVPTISASIADTKISTPPPVAPEPPPKDEIAEAEKAYAGFLTDYAMALRKRNREAASELVAQAGKNTVLKPLQKEVEESAKAVGWLADLEAALITGVEKLREADDFDLQTKSNQTIHIGKRAAFQLIDRKEATINLGSKEIGMALPLANLSAQSWRKLVELGLGSDANGILRRAFLEVLMLKDNDAPGRSTAKAMLARAKTAGAAAEDIDYLTQMIDVSAKGAREVLAEDALRRFEKCFETKSWPEADRLGRQLLTDYADTSVVKSKAGLRDMVVSARAKGSPVKEYTLVFQQGEAVYDAGIEKYSGTMDCYLYSDWPDMPFTTYSMDKANLMMGKGWIVPLIRFSVFQREGGPLPNDAEILNTTLSVYKVNAYSFNVDAKRCTTPWKFEEVSWNSAAKGTAWYTPGGDASDQAVSKIKSAWEAGWVDIDVTESMRQNQKEGKDCGWLLYCVDQNNIVNLASSRNKDQSLRPKLKIKVRTTAMK